MDTNVEVAQVYQDQDPRMSYRRVKVVGIENGKALIQSVTGMGSILKVRLDRMRPIGKSKGFRLVV